MRSTFWLATGAAALPLVIVAVLGLRGSAPPVSAILDPPRATQAAHAAPSAPAAAPTVLDRPPSFDIVNIDPAGQAVIAGRAAPGARVRVLDGDTPIGDATADARGEWVVVTKAPLEPLYLNTSLLLKLRTNKSVVSYRRCTAGRDNHSSRVHL